MDTPAIKSLMSGSYIIVFINREAERNSEVWNLEEQWFTQVKTQNSTQCIWRSTWLHKQFINPAAFHLAIKRVLFPRKHIYYFFNETVYFEIIEDSHKVVRNNSETFHVPLNQFPLTGYETIVWYHKEKLNIDAIHSMWIGFLKYFMRIL